MKPKYTFLNPSLFRGKTLREIGIKSLVDWNNPRRSVSQIKPVRFTKAEWIRIKMSKHLTKNNEL